MYYHKGTWGIVIKVFNKIFLDILNSVAGKFRDNNKEKHMTVTAEEVIRRLIR